MIGSGTGPRLGGAYRTGSKGSLVDRILAPRNGLVLQASGEMLPVRMQLSEAPP